MEHFIHVDPGSAGFTPEPGLFGDSLFIEPMSGDTYQLLAQIDSEVGQAEASANAAIQGAQHSVEYGTPSVGTHQSSGYVTSFSPGAYAGLQALNVSDEIANSVSRDMLAADYQTTAENLSAEADSGYGLTSGDTASYSE
jgi:hypothetical protein